MAEPRGLRLSDLLILTLFIVGLYVAWTVRNVLLLIYVSIIFAVVFTPAVHALQRIRIGRWSPSRGAAVLILAFLAVGTFVLFVALMLPPIVEDAQQIGQEIPSQLGQLGDRIRTLPMGNKVADSLSPQTLEQNAGALVKNAFRTAQTFFAGLANLALLAILVPYFILDGRRAFNWAMCLVPSRRRERLRETLLAASGRVQRWLVGQALLMLILGVLSFVVLWALGVRYFYGLAVFAGLANFVPILGPLVTVALAGIVAAMDSWFKLAGVITFYLAYQQLENAYLSPRIMESTLHLAPVAVIIALAIGAALAGVLGAVVAVPTAALIATVMDEYMLRCEPKQVEYRRAS